MWCSIIGECGERWGFGLFVSVRFSSFVEVVIYSTSVDQQFRVGFQSVIRSKKSISVCKDDEVSRKEELFAVPEVGTYSIQFHQIYTGASTDKHKIQLD